MLSGALSGSLNVGNYHILLPRSTEWRHCDMNTNREPDYHALESFEMSTVCRCSGERGIIDDDVLLIKFSVCFYVR